MKTTSTRTLLSALLLGCGLSMGAQQLAFPGAQGFGRYATGGRSGSVYHVTNLNDSGTGSLRDAVSQPNRIVVFDVSGVININSRISFAKNLYVAGQTAPGEGIIVYGDGVSFSSADNTIVRHMRFRMGHSGTSGKDAAGIANGKNMIFDHCSFSWGLDETFSINWDNKGASPQMITLQNCVIGQGLLSHSAGGLMQADSITIYRCLYCDNATRNPKTKGTQQFVNNIVYNWSDGGYLMGGDSEGTSRVNATNNLFINGPSGTGAAFTRGNSDFNIYAVDNLQDKNRDGELNPSEIQQSEYSGGPTFAAEPFGYPQLEAWAAASLVDSLLPGVGASLPYRDFADFYMVHQVKSFGTEGATISTENQLPFGAPSTWEVKSFTKPTDTDGDGMPDEWEAANGTDPSKDDAMTIAANGYANIENYINSLTTDNRTIFLRTPLYLATKTSTETTITLSWSNYTEGEDGIIVEQMIDGEYKEIGRTEADAEEYTVENLTEGTAYQFRVKAYKGDSYVSEYTETTAKTQPKKVEMIDCEAFEGDDDRNWLIDTPTPETYTLDASTEKDAVVVRTDADVVITGAGSLDGSMSLNKTRGGKLTLETENGYTGATVLHEGTISFATLKDGGVNSGIGASLDYAQNWIWDGGTWNYTGPSTSTNRSAQIYKATELNIENSSTVSMSGSIEGSGDVTVSGQGTLAPASEEFFKYDGNTVLKDGATLKLPYMSSLTNKLVYMSDGTDLNKLVLSGGNFTVSGASGLYISYMFPIEVVEGTTSTFTIQKNAYWKSNVTGSGTLQYNVPYVREYISGDWTQFYGRLIANGTGSDKDGSQLMLQKGFKGMPNAKLTLKGNTRMICWDTNDEQYIGGLSGDAGTYLSGSSKNTDGAKMIWHVGGAGTNETFNGIIDNRTSASGHEANVSIVKEGQGDWTLTGKNVYKGTTTVKAGRLIVNGTNSGTGAYSVSDGATLAGTGTLGGAVTLNTGATIMAADSDSVATGSTLILNGALTVNEGATVYVPASSSESNTITLKSGMAIGDNATLRLAEEQLDGAPYAATKYQLFSVAGGTITGTFAEIIPATPGEGQTWDTSALYTDGVLTVVGGEENPNQNPDPDPEPQPDTETKTTLISWGSMTTGSYDDSGVNNMLVGTEDGGTEGFKMVITSNLAKAYTAADKINVEYGGETVSRTTIKCSNGAVNSLFLPSDAKATKMTIWSYTNYTGTTPRTCYWASVAGVDYTEETTTVLKGTKDTSSPNMAEFALDDVEDVVTFKNTGEQQCVVIVLEYHYGETNGIDGVDNGGSTPVRVDYYTLSGERVAEMGGGIYIMRATMANGKTVTRKVAR